MKDNEYYELFSYELSEPDTNDGPDDDFLKDRDEVESGLGTEDEDEDFEEDEDEPEDLELEDPNSSDKTNDDD